jgi:hypothetical protein
VLGDVGEHHLGGDGRGLVEAGLAPLAIAQPKPPKMILQRTSAAKILPSGSATNLDSQAFPNQAIQLSLGGHKQKIRSRMVSCGRFCLRGLFA